jgi:ABC-type phosphate transport system substrate-binding protein
VLSAMKRKTICFTRTAAWLLGGAVLAISGEAAAANCPAGTTTVYMSGSSAFLPVVQATANALGSAVNIVYQKPGSCEGLDYLLGDTGVAIQPDQDTAYTMAPNGPASPASCTLPTITFTNTTGTMTTAPAAKVDIGISDVYASTCISSFDPMLVPVGTMTKDFLGPIQAMTIAVPSASTENVISAEAAYMVFGFAAGSAANTIAPWNVPADIFVRFWDSGTLEMVATAINLAGGKFVNATNKSSAQTTANSQGMATALTTAAAKGMTDTNAAIGILGAANLVTGTKALAFQAKGQSCGYLPDSDSSHGDKINVRQGRYDIWGPEHMITNVDSSGNPVGQNSNTAAVQMVIEALLSTSQAPAAMSGDAGTALTDAQVGAIIDAISAPASGVVPWCAMQVQRTMEIGPEASYQPPAACSCRFEMAAGGALTGHTCTACTAATAATTCTGSTTACRFGYCEAK